MVIESIEEDSRIKAPNSLFCCLKGSTHDGHNHVQEAIQNGAVAIMASKNLITSVPVLKVRDVNKGMVQALSRFYDKVDEKLKLIGVTGTDGKTSVASMLYQLINKVDSCGYLGTNGVKCHNYEKKMDFTTPFPKDLFYYLSIFDEAGCRYVAMEVSSERLQSKRLNQLKYDVAIFTNLTMEHLNTHKTMTNYVRAKGELFKQLKQTGYAIINNDDLYAPEIKKMATGKVITYGIKNKADVLATDIVIKENYLSFHLKLFNQDYDIESPLSGLFNVYNLMAVITACAVSGLDIKVVVKNIKTLMPIKARLEFINYNQPFKIVLDYAHTPNALKNLLDYLRLIAKGRIITVTGSAGGRDKGKRPIIGQVVTSLSDYVIFTMDDPRFEEVDDIINEMVSQLDKKVNNYERIVDRGTAIHQALSMAKVDDIVVIAGRGHDKYIPIKGKDIPYSDAAEIKKFFKMQ
ncbi:MAG: UDP-N-acetylmuramoyl-L-alanyl-D-glutamate--2,6-diaminopimelate ligase [Bacilli bacterium]